MFKNCRASRLFRVMTVMIVAIVSLATSIAQSPSGDKGQFLPKHKASVVTKLSQDKVHAGSPVFVLLIVTIQEGWHINSSTPSEANIIGTSVEVSKSKAVENVVISFPNTIEKTFIYSDTPLEVYEGTFEILIRFVVTPDVKLGAYLVPVTLGYQACSNSVCLAPAILKIDLQLNVVPMNEPTRLIKREFFERYPEVLK